MYLYFFIYLWRFGFWQRNAIILVWHTSYKSDFPIVWKFTMYALFSILFDQFWNPPSYLLRNVRKVCMSVYTKSFALIEITYVQNMKKTWHCHFQVKAINNYFSQKQFRQPYLPYGHCAMGQDVNIVHTDVVSYNIVLQSKHIWIDFLIFFPYLYGRM